MGRKKAQPKEVKEIKDAPVVTGKETPVEVVNALDGRHVPPPVHGGEGASEYPR